MRTRFALTLALLLVLLLPRASLAEGQVFHVAPSGGDDTVALETALGAAQAAGPESVVELEAGDYAISRALVTHDWSGTIRGQGKDATLLHTIVGAYSGIDIQDAYGLYSVAGMLMFMYEDGDQGGVRVEGLGFHPEGVSIYDGVTGDVTIVPIFGATMSIGTSAHMDIDVRDVRISGGITGVGMVIMRNTGDVSVADTIIENVLGFGIIGVTWPGGSLSVGGQRPQDRVTLSNIGAGGIFGFANQGTAFEIANVRAENVGVVYQQHALSGGRVHMSGVETVNGAGAAVLCNWDYDPMHVTTSVPSTYRFEHNTIRLPEGAGWAGFTGLDWCPVKSQFVISQNRIESAVTDVKGPILLNDTRGAVVTNNLLTGTGLAGVSLGLFGGEDSGAVLKGNNLQGFEGTVGVLLAAATSGNTVVGGGSLRTLVFDEDDDPATPEYEGDNILSGVNSAGGAIGEAVRAAMQARQDACDLFR